MIDSERYQCKRRERWRLIVAVLRRHHLLNALRGSWKYNDFHFDSVDESTRSDLDLVVDGMSSVKRLELEATLQMDFADNFALRVSIHGADSLLKMSLADSFMLNTGEFIAKTQKLEVGSPDYDYTLAKIVLLLLRTSPEERYNDVANRIGTPEVRLALDVKLGLDSAFPTEKALLLLCSSEHAIAREFIEECVLTVPSPNFVDTVRCHIRRCHTIAPWLQEYLINKINGFAT